MPVRDNLFQQVLQQIRQNTQVQHVYAWLPVLAGIAERSAVKLCATSSMDKRLYSPSPFEQKT